MPFDGTDPCGAAAIAMIDALFMYFDGGKKWLGTGDFHDDDGRRCLVGAMAHIRHRDKIKGDATSRYVRLAVRQTPCVRMELEQSVQHINDACRDYRELALILLRARAMAAGTAVVPTQEEIRQRLAEIAAQRQAAFERCWAYRQAVKRLKCHGQAASAPDRVAVEGAVSFPQVILRVPAPKTAPAPPNPQRIAAQSALVLGMVETSLQAGAMWVRGAYRSPDGKRCLLEAVHQARRELGGGVDRATDYLARAIRNRRRDRTYIHAASDSTIITFNDRHERSWRQIAAVIRKAKALASAEAETPANEMPQHGVAALVMA